MYTNKFIEKYRTHILGLLCIIYLFWVEFYVLSRPVKEDNNEQLKTITCKLIIPDNNSIGYRYKVNITIKDQKESDFLLLPKQGFLTKVVSFAPHSRVKNTHSYADPRTS